MLSVNGVDYYNRAVYTQNPKENSVNFGRIKGYALQDKPENIDKTNNGKFDFSEAGKNFLKGIISPITAAIKHPIATIGLVAGTIAACSFVPILGPALAVGFGAYSLLQIGKGCYDVAKNCANGDYDAAEKSFTTVGEGTVGTALSALGIRQSARIAKEAKLMSELNATTLTSAQRDTIAQTVKETKFIGNLKETLKLFTTKDGLKAIRCQFKSDMLKARFEDVKNLFDKSKWTREKEVEIGRKTKNLKERIKEFKESPEGKRRAALTEEQVKAELEALYDDAFERLGVPKEQRPQLNIKTKEASHGGYYSTNGHKIEFNPEAYKSGVMEIENVIMHEATHCKEALLRAGIPQDRVDVIVVDELIGRIRNGEAEEIIKGANLFGADMAKPPKMNNAMKEDFIQFAKDNLYNKDKDIRKIISNYDNQLSYKRHKISSFKIEEFQEAEKAAEPILNKLRTLMNKHPDFVKQYGTEQEALEALVEYSKAHNFRYNFFTNTKINRSTQSGKYADYVDVEPLTGEALTRAEQSLVDEIATIEGNGRASGFKIFGPSNKEFNQYQFSPEEVLAQKNGNNYLIEKMTAKMNEMRKAGTLTPEQEAYMTKAIEKAKLVIEYKTKGLEYYKKYTQMINNPDDKKLAAEVEAMSKELDTLKATFQPKEWERITKIVKEFAIPDHNSVLIPNVAIYQIINSLGA